MSVSYERAALLMTVIKLAAELGPREANSITGMAAAELRAMDDEARKELAGRAEKAKREAAAAEAEAAKPKEAPADETIFTSDLGKPNPIRRT